MTTCAKCGHEMTPKLSISEYCALQPDGTYKVVDRFEERSEVCFDCTRKLMRQVRQGIENDFALPTKPAEAN